MRTPPKLVAIFALFAAIFSAKDGQSAGTDTAIEKAHGEIWDRFIDEYGTMLDYTDLEGNWEAPTREECLENKPNALAWWMPNENGAMFNGLYLDAMCQRWALTGRDEDREKCRRLANGLRFLASVSGTPGFIARGVATDGKTVYPMGSNDQTFPWFYGLWRYLSSGIASTEEKAEIISEMNAVAKELQQHEWKMPCAREPFKFRGSFSPITWEAAPRLLFLFRMMHEITGEKEWKTLYETHLDIRDTPERPSRRELCAQGMKFHSTHRHSWTGAVSVCALRGLWELETDPALRQDYAKGLQASAALAAESIGNYSHFQNDTDAHFEVDWRKLNQWWREQNSEADAVAVAKEQLRKLGKMSPRRYQETSAVREPLFAAWIVTLCPETEVVLKHRSEIEAAIQHYDYERLYFSQFFPAENAWYRLKAADIDLPAVK